MSVVTGCEDEDVTATECSTDTELRDSESTLTFSVPFQYTMSKVYSCIAKAQH